MKTCVALAFALTIAPAMAQMVLTPPVTKNPPKATKKSLIVDPLIAEAKAAVSAKLKDPMSAAFQNLQTRSGTNLKGQPTQAVCGEVNAKNSYGGYTGFQRWIYVKDSEAMIMGNADTDFVTNAMLAHFCS